MSSLLEDKIDQKFDIQVILHEIYEDLQPCQLICNQRYETNHSNCFSSPSFSEILCQGETLQDQVV